MDTILIKTAFCCMACDGDISEDEIKMLESSSLLSDFSKDDFLREVSSFKNDGKKYLKDYVALLADKSMNMLSEKKTSILRLAVDMIKADGVVKYSEIKFFKLIMSVLNVSPKFVLENIEDIDDDWVDSDFSQSKDELSKSFFGNFQLNAMDTANINQLELIKEE